MRDSTNPQPPRPDKNKEITVAQFSSARSKLHSELVPDILLSAGSVSSTALLFVWAKLHALLFCGAKKKSLIQWKRPEQSMHRVVSLHIGFDSRHVRQTRRFNG